MLKRSGLHRRGHARQPKVAQMARKPDIHPKLSGKPLIRRHSHLYTFILK
ncbi:hypothetical protein [Azospirillum endophyticum]